MGEQDEHVLLRLGLAQTGLGTERDMILAALERIGATVRLPENPPRCYPGASPPPREDRLEVHTGYYGPFAELAFDADGRLTAWDNYE